MEHVNREIANRKSNAGLNTPWLAKFCHRYSRGKYTNIYKSLKDGVHGNSKIREQWAAEIHYIAKKSLGLDTYIAPEHIKVNIENEMA